ncbi:hypothetical protein [Paraburkholderia caledonica]|uniref:hypothetical protein n=1 Tax=Paraburkholderia caledonica TaxID=134536 RepID=UPI00035DD330|nr:hypothetical protein [Paraburkholderia caledonica]
MQDFEALARMIINDDPQLDTLHLPADGTFQKVPTTLEELTCNVAADLADLLGAHAGQAPTLTFLWGPCRVGSTALLNVFAESGFKAIYQPIKNLLRSRLNEQSKSDLSEITSVFSLTPPRTVVKETSGPYTVAECLFNPLDALLRSGFPPSKVQLIVLSREPTDMLASWTRKWSSRVSTGDLHAHFLLARLNERRIRRAAEQASIPVFNFTSTPGREAVSAVRNLFEAIDLADRFEATKLEGWAGSDPLCGSFSSVVFPREPGAFELSNLHDPLPGYGMGKLSLDRPSDFRTHERIFVSHGLGKLFGLAVETLSAERDARKGG